MQIIRSGAITEHKTTVALGNFDGLHRAHMKIIENCIGYARKNGALSCVLLFCDHTECVTKNKKISLLTDEEEKLKILGESGIDLVYLKSFDKEFMRLSPIEFVEFLKNKLNANAVCVGYDYRFGYKAEGDTKLLKKLCSECGIEVIVADEMKYNDTVIKSTKIRELVADGDIAGANALLGRPFSLTGEVVRGLQNGRKIGTPTANVAYKDNKILPQNGVYSGYTNVSGKRYKSVINVGNNPTFNADKVTVESHILDFSGDIYGQTVTVEFINRIRSDIKFNGIDELKNQIQKDIMTAKNEP